MSIFRQTAPILLVKNDVDQMWSQYGNIAVFFGYIDEKMRDEVLEAEM